MYYEYTEINEVMKNEKSKKACVTWHWVMGEYQTITDLWMFNLLDPIRLKIIISKI